MSSDRTVRPTVLTFIRHYLPGGRSGATRAVADMVAALEHEFSFRIVAFDRDVGDAMPFPGIETGVWQRRGNAEVMYLGPDRRGLSSISGILRRTPHDLLFLNSFFDPVMTITPLLARFLRLAPGIPCSIGPNGEFNPGALSQKRLKKQAFLALGRGLYGGLTWQATNSVEAAEIKTVMGRRAVDIQLAPYPVRTLALPVMKHPPRRTGEPLRICFLSRISPKKNLTYALAVLANVKSPARFDIYGPIDDPDYWEQCQPLIARLPANVQAAYAGSVEPDDVMDRLVQYDLFFLPTLGENFGYAIHEALCAGTSALISDTTPWRNLAANAAGWDLPLARPDLFVQAIETIAGCSPMQLSAQRESARAAGERGALEAEPVEAMRQLLHNAIGRGSGA